MATVSGVITNYVAEDYIDDQGGYLLGPARLSVTATADGNVEFFTVNGGATEWVNCGTWATWPNSRWSPGIKADTSLTTSSTGVATRSATASADLLLTSPTQGNAIFGPTVSSNTVITSSSTGNVTFAPTVSSDINFTVVAEGGKLLHGVASGNLTITVSAAGERQPGGTATADLSITSTATGVVVISAEATADLQFTATGTGNLTFLGNATANISLTTTLAGGLVQKPSNPNTVYVVDSETRVYVTEVDAVNDSAGLHLGHNYYKIPITGGETRVYRVLFDTRTHTIKSETRTQPTEVY